jgi:hypothetical protein
VCSTVTVTYYGATSMKTFSWTLALGHVLSLGPYLPNQAPSPLYPLGEIVPESLRKTPRRLTYTSALYCTKDSTNLYSLFGLGVVSFLHTVTCRVNIFAWTNHRSPTRFDITLALNNPRCVRIRYIHEEMHRRLDDKLTGKC